MKSNVKRFLALMTAATMLAAPCTAYGSSVESNSTGSLEFDNSTAPDVGSVVLPTVTDDTFKFIIDPEDRLNEYRPETYTNPGSGIYFESTATKGGIVAAANTGAAMDVYVKVASASAIDALNAAVTLSAGAVYSVSTAQAFYVWAPDTTSGAGIYVPLKKDNISQYFKFDTTKTTGAIQGFKPRIGNATTDQMIYVDQKETLAANYDPTDYVTVNSAGSVTLLPGVIVKSGSAIMSESALAIAGAETTWTNRSEELRIINKSTKNYTITAEVTVDVQSGSGLVYLNSASAISVSSDAALHFDIINTKKGEVSTKSAITTNGTSITGKSSVDLAAASGSAIHYISKEFSEGTLTGGDEFKQYVCANPVTEEVSFQIEASVSTIEDAMDAWRAYADKLTENKTSRPTIKVVYSFEETDDESDSVDLGLIPANEQIWAGSGNTRNIKMVAPQGVTELTSLKYSTDGENYTSVSSNNGGIYQDGSNYLIWLYTNPWGSTATHVYLQFESSGTVYNAQLW